MAKNDAWDDKVYVVKILDESGHVKGYLNGVGELAANRADSGVVFSGKKRSLDHLGKKWCESNSTKKKRYQYDVVQIPIAEVL